MENLPEFSDNVDCCSACAYAEPDEGKADARSFPRLRDWPDAAGGLPAADVILASIEWFMVLKINVQVCFRVSQIHSPTYKGMF